MGQYSELEEQVLSLVNIMETPQAYCNLKC